MNRPIIRLFGFVAVLFALLVAFTSRWTVFEASSLRDNPLNARTLLEQRADRNAGRSSPPTARVLARSVPRPRRHVYQRIYPTGDAVRPRRRLLLSPDLGSTRPRALPQRRARAARRARNLQIDPRPAPGQANRRRQGHHDARPERPAQVASRRSAGTTAPCGARSAHRRGRRVMASTPATTRTRCARRAAYASARRTTPRAAARQPRHPVRLRARLDVQGRHRHGRDRHRCLHAGIDRQRAQRRAHLGRAAPERPERELRADHAHRQRSRTRSTPSGRRSPNASASRTLARYMERFGFDRKPQLDYPRGRDVDQRRVLARAPDLAAQPAGRRRPHRHRPGQTRGDAAADGRGRSGGRQRRRADGPPPDAAHRRLRRPHRADGLPARAVTS